MELSARGKNGALKRTHDKTHAREVRQSHTNHIDPFKRFITQKSSRYQCQICGALVNEIDSDHDC